LAIVALVLSRAAESSKADVVIGSKALRGSLRDDGHKSHGSIPAGVPWSRYYAGVEGIATAEWDKLIWPRIQGSNFHSVLEISPGGGRWAEIFSRHATRYVGVDVNAPGIQYLSGTRFANASHLSFYANDGTSLPMVPNRSVTFAFSWDSMVHFPPDAVLAYIRELARVLRPGGTTFLHHAHLRLCNRNDACPGAYTCVHKTDANGPTHLRGVNGKAIVAHRTKHPQPLFPSTPVHNSACGVAVHAEKNPHARNAGTTCESVAAEAQARGLVVIRQERCGWPWCDPTTGIDDCLTQLQKPRGTHHGRAGS